MLHLNINMSYIHRHNCTLSHSAQRTIIHVHSHNCATACAFTVVCLYCDSQLKTLTAYCSPDGKLRSTAWSCGCLHRKWYKGLTQNSHSQNTSHLVLVLSPMRKPVDHKSDLLVIQTDYLKKKKNSFSVQTSQKSHLQLFIRNHDSDTF